MTRELTEELGATATLVSRVFLHSTTSDSATHVQHFYLARLTTLHYHDGRGPEFDEPNRGRYDLERINLHGSDLDTVDLKPTELKEFIKANRDVLLAEVGASTTSQR